MPRKSVHVLDPSQLRVLGNPLRQEILTALCREPLSAARLTERLERPPANLHYHLDRLHQARLIELVEERPVRGATEKLFRAVAANFSVADETLAGLASPAVRHRVLGMIRRHARWTLAELGPALIQAGAPPVTSHQRLRLTPAQARRLRRRLVAWLEECRRSDEATTAGSDPSEEWVLFSAFFRRAGNEP